MQSSHYSSQILTKLELSQQIFKKYSNTKFYSYGSQVLPCGRRDTQTDGRTKRKTDITKLMVAFRNFANAPKIYVIHCFQKVGCIST